MYYLTARDKDGYIEYLYGGFYDPDTDGVCVMGRLYSFVTKDHAMSAMAFLKAKIHAKLTTPVYESKPIALGLLRKDVLVPMDPKLVLELRRIKDTMEITQLPNQFYNLRGINL